MEYDLDLILDVFLPPILTNSNAEEGIRIQPIDTFSAADVSDLCHGVDPGNHNLHCYLNSIATVSAQFSDQYKSIVKKVLQQRRDNDSISPQHYQFFQMFLSAIQSHHAFANDYVTRTSLLQQQIKSSAVAIQTNFNANFMVGLHEAALLARKNESITPQQHHHVTLFKNFVNAHRVQHYGHLLDSNEYYSNKNCSNTIVQSNEEIQAHNPVPAVIAEKFNDNTTLAVIDAKEANTVIDKVIPTLPEVTLVATKQLHPADTDTRLVTNNQTKKHQDDANTTTGKRNLKNSFTPMKGCVVGAPTPRKKMKLGEVDLRVKSIRISPRLSKKLVSGSSVKDSESTSQHSVRDHEEKDYRPSDSSNTLSSAEVETLYSNDESSIIKKLVDVCHDNVDDDQSSDAEDEDYTPSVCNDYDLHLDSDMERTDDDVSHDASYQADLKQYHKEAFYTAYAPYYKGASNSTKLITNEKYDRIKEIIRKPKVKNESAVILKYRRLYSIVGNVERRCLYRQNKVVATFEEVFDIILEAHSRISHARSAKANLLCITDTLGYYGIPIKAVQFFVSTCPLVR
jgi:hypothetical protein